MKYTIDVIGTDEGWRYCVTLWCGRNCYRGKRAYKRHRDALKAAKATLAEEISA